MPAGRGRDPAPAVRRTPQFLSPTGKQATQVDIEVDGASNATVLWSSLEGANSRIQAAMRPAGGSFGAAQTLNNTSQSATDPVLGVANDGSAVAAWINQNGTYTMQAAFRPGRRPSLGGFSDVSAAFQNLYKPVLAMNPPATP